jgi:RNA polymerase sigma factor (sigma-70 family)
VAQSDFYAELDPSTLQRAQRGDRAAFEAIYRQYRRASYTLALRVLGEAAAAEDVVQDVFVRLFDAIKRFRGAAPFGAWLRRLVANATVDELRRRRWLDDSIEPETFTSGAQIAGLPEQQAEAWNLLQRVPPVARAVLVLHEVEGYTHKEMALMFGQSESYSKSILARALHRLSALSAPSAEYPTESKHVRTRRA